MGREKYLNRSTRRVERENPGCMSGVLQFFDFHQSQFSLQPCFKPNSFLEKDSPILKGLEAPRNSLELKETPLMEDTSLSSILREEDLKIPKRIRLETKREEISKSSMEDLFSESSSSSGTKTPNLVARLMGLDLLPETFSPSSSSIHVRRNSPGKLHQILLQDLNGSVSKRENQSRQIHESKSSKTRKILMENEAIYDIKQCHSLPETPRISSARRSDVDHRLSLQINKENLIRSEELDYCSRMRNKDLRVEDESRSPSNYARQIVKQVRESVSRKVGLDITNTITRNRGKEGDYLSTKSKKTRHFSDESNSCSPRLRFLELKNKPVSTLSYSSSSTSEKSASVKPKSPSLQNVKIKKCKKTINERFNRLKNPPKNASAAAKSNLLSDKKCKSFLPTNKHQIQSKEFQASKLCAQLSNRTSQISEQQATEELVNQGNQKPAGAGEGAEFRYVNGILKRTGIESNTPVSFATWHSPSNPLDPSVFTHLENSFTVTSGAGAVAGNPLKHRCNRKLLFNLVNEILVDLLKPHFNGGFIFFPSFETSHQIISGSELLKQLWNQICSFPLANCQILQDIDALIEKDLPESNIRNLPIWEEGESLAFEIERDILDSLIRETTALLTESPARTVTGGSISDEDKF